MHYMSFIIRLWSSGYDPDQEPGTCHGQIEHIQSGTNEHISSLEDVQHFMQRWLEETMQTEVRREENVKIEQ